MGWRGRGGGVVRIKSRHIKVHAGSEILDKHDLHEEMH